MGGVLQEVAYGGYFVALRLQRVQDEGKCAERCRHTVVHGMQQDDGAGAHVAGSESDEAVGVEAERQIEVGRDVPEYGLAAGLVKVVGQVTQLCAERRAEADGAFIAQCADDTVGAFHLGPDECG